jgi:hypothetical protein
MDDENGKAALEKRLLQARRLYGETTDPTTSERLAELIRDLEQQMRKLA